jgi:hypothetical protein
VRPSLVIVIGTSTADAARLNGTHLGDIGVEHRLRRAIITQSASGAMARAGLEPARDGL